MVVDGAGIVYRHLIRNLLEYILHGLLADGLTKANCHHKSAADNMQMSAKEGKNHQKQQTRTDIGEEQTNKQIGRQALRRFYFRIIT